MLMHVVLGSLYHPKLGAKVGTGGRNLVVELGRKWVKLTNPYTLASETIERTVWDEHVAPKAKPTTLNARKLKAQGLKDIEARTASYRLSLETGSTTYTDAQVEHYVTTYRKGLTKRLNKVVEAAKIKST